MLYKITHDQSTSSPEEDYLTGNQQSRYGVVVHVAKHNEIQSLFSFNFGLEFFVRKMVYTANNKTRSHECIS